MVEDDLSLQKVIQIKLEQCGFKVVTAKSVEDAFCTEILEMDGIWLDHNLIGKETGIDFVVKYKSNTSKYKEVPIFVVSNTSSLDLKKTYTTYGVQNYFVKAEYKLGEIIKQIQITLKV